MDKIKKANKHRESRNSIKSKLSIKYKLNIILVVITTGWLLAQIIAPLSLEQGSVNFGNDGKVGVDDHKHSISKMNNSFAQLIYKAGDVWCHQKSSRSLFIYGNQMPFCARCFGIFLGLALGSFPSMFIRIRLKWWWLVGGIVPMGVDGTLQLLGFYESINPVRLLTGALAGIVTGLLLGLIFQELWGGWYYYRYTKKGYVKGRITN